MGNLTAGENLPNLREIAWGWGFPKPPFRLMTPAASLLRQGRRLLCLPDVAACRRARIGKASLWDRFGLPPPSGSAFGALQSHHRQHDGPAGRTGALQGAGDQV